VAILNGFHDRCVNQNVFVTLANISEAHLEIRMRIVFGNICYYSDQKLALFQISEDIQTILLFVFYGCEIWPLTLKLEHKLQVSGNKVLRIYL
jgi:hypothetical protein